MFSFPHPFSNKKKKVMTHNISISRYFVVLFLFWNPNYFPTKKIACFYLYKSSSNLPTSSEVLNWKYFWALLFSESLLWTTLKILQAEFQFEIRTSHNVLKSCWKRISKWPLTLRFSDLCYECEQQHSMTPVRWPLTSTQRTLWSLLSVLFY